jgi:riboflavin kinase/FMN adenylyltransferase
MKVLNQLIKSKTKKAVALGFFDGVHIGHRYVIETMIKNSDSLLPSVFTFKESPKVYLLGCKFSENLTDPSQKESIFSDLGVKLTYTIPFVDICNLSPKEFIENILINTLNAKRVFCGLNYHFGKYGKADSIQLKHMCKNYNIDVFIVPTILKNSETVSSTRIRKLLTLGKIDAANALLNRPYSFQSNVFKSCTQNSNTLLFQYFPQNLLVPKLGTYTSQVNLGFSKISAYTSIFSLNREKTQYCCKTNLKNYNYQGFTGLLTKIELLHLN